MFDIGFTELVIVGIVGLIVIGPDQLPSTIRTISLWLGRIRRGFNEAKQEIEKELGADEVRAQLHNEAIMKSLQDVKNDVENELDTFKHGVNNLEAQVKNDEAPHQKGSQLSPPKQEPSDQDSVNQGSSNRGHADDNSHTS